MPKLYKVLSFLSLIFYLIIQSSSVVFASEQATALVSLQVPLHAGDIPLTLERINGGGAAQEDAALTYKITYGTRVSYPLPLTITASWSQASVNGLFVDLADYENGSGTDAYGATPPIIDTLNKTITWNIPSIPPGIEDQTVTFNLKTNSNYTGIGQIYFSVTASALSNGEAVTPVSINQYYEHTISSPSTSSGTSSTPPRATTTPTPISTPTLSLLTSVSIQTISSNTATAFVAFSDPSEITVRYGTAPTRLTNSVKVAQKITSYPIVFPDLLPDTPYYFTITAISDTRRSTSDLYTFTTSKEKATSVVDLTSLIITSDNLILSAFQNNYGRAKTALPSVVITVNSPFDFRFSVSDNQKIKEIFGSMRDTKVLGLSNYTQEITNLVTSTSTEIIELGKGIYSGRLKTQTSPGVYTLFVRISDEFGNISEEPLATITVVNPLTIREEGSKRPLENVRVLLYRKHPRTGEYTLLSEQSVAVKNPLFSLSDGTVLTNLLQGEYKAHISAIGYSSVDTYFTISPSNETSYPTVYLTKRAFSLSNTLTYYVEITGDVFASFRTFLSTLGISNRFFNLVSLIALLCFVIVTTLSFCIRFHVPFTALPLYGMSLLHLQRSKKTVASLSGTIIDADTQFPLYQAIIYLLDGKKKRIVLHAQTDKLGHFTLPLIPASAHVLLIKKRHYISLTHPVATRDDLIFSLSEDPTSENHFIASIQFFLRTIVGLCFELLLFLSFLLEIVFAASFGVITALPYVVLSTMTLLIWVLYVKNRRYR